MNNNAITLTSYEQRAEEYISGTRQIVTGDNKDWLDRFSGPLPQNANILELGSSFGRDATYLEERGYKVVCSDAVPSFINYLETAGHTTKFIDVLKDSLEGTYDAVLANMVFLHFDAKELALVLGKVKAALKPGGVLAFSVRRGEGSEWSTDKLGAPRFYKYWSSDDLEKLVSSNGFKIIDMRDGNSTNPDKIYVLAKPFLT